MNVSAQKCKSFIIYVMNAEYVESLIFSFYPDIFVQRECHNKKFIKFLIEDVNAEM